MFCFHPSNASWSGYIQNRCPWSFIIHNQKHCPPKCIFLVMDKSPLGMCCLNWWNLCIFAIFCMPFLASRHWLTIRDIGSLFMCLDIINFHVFSITTLLFSSLSFLLLYITSFALGSMANWWHKKLGSMPDISNVIQAKRCKFAFISFVNSLSTWSVKAAPIFIFLPY